MRPVLALALLAAPALAGCAGESAGPAPDVMATHYPLQFLAQRIVGPDFLVASVVKPGVEPHEYEATPVDVRRIADAKALVILGAGFEGWLRTAQEQAPGTKLVVATEGVSLAPNPDAGEAGELPSDPHAWLDPVLAQDMARAIERGLAGAFPERALQLKENADALVSDLARLDAEYRAGLATCEVRLAITNHAAYGYLASRYNFTELAISGLEPEGQPDPRTMSRIIDEARARNVTVIFFEDLVSPDLAEAIASEVGATTRVLSPIESIAAERVAQGADYFTLMRENLDALKDGMRCAP